MSNTINYGSIVKTFVSNSQQRFVEDTWGNYYFWNDFNQSYQPLNLSSFPNMEITGIDCDNEGNLYFLGYGSSNGSMGYKVIT